MKRVVFIILLISQISCSRTFVPTPLGDDIDRMQIHANNGSIYSSTDINKIRIFKNVLIGKGKRFDQSWKIGCAFGGVIWFMSGNSVRQMATFVNTEPGCKILVITEDQGDPFYTFQLSPEASFYLDSLMKTNDLNVRAD